MTDTKTGASSGFDPQDAIAAMLDELEPSSIDSGLLQHPFETLVGSTDFDGSDDAEAVELPLFRQIVGELSDWSLGPVTFADYDTYFRDAQAQVIDAVIPIGTIDVRHHRVKPEVWSSLANATTADQAWVAPAAADAIEDNRLFAAAPLCAETVIDGSVEFEVGGKWHISNTGELPTAFEVDLDDGRGLQRVEPGGRVRATYATAGDKHITVFAEYPYGRRCGQSVCKVKDVEVPRWDASWPIDERFEDADVKAGVYVWYARGRTHIERPAIMLSGFDPKNRFTPCLIYYLYDRHGLLREAREAGFDIVLMHYGHAGIRIQANAHLLRTLLRQLAAEQPEKKPGVIMSASMGGLIARYALLHMENRQEEHGIEIHLSVDTPHRGAVVPLAVQYFLDFFGNFKEASEWRDIVLNSPAARQMLLVHYKKGWEKEVKSPEPGDAFEAFYGELEAMGNYPAIENYAVASGRGDGKGQPFGPGDLLLRWQLIRSSSILPYADPMNALPARGQQAKVFEAQQVRRWTAMVEGTDALDSIPGGTGDFVEQLHDIVTKLRLLNHRWARLEMKHGRTCFIPTVSAVDQKGPLDAPIKGKEHTPFEDIFCEDDNEPHIYVTKKCSDWMSDKLGFAKVQA